MYWSFQGGRQKLWDRHGTGQAADGASNAIDIAIAITGFNPESSMMFSWNSAAVEPFAKPLFGLGANSFSQRGPKVSGVSISAIRIRTP